MNRIWKVARVALIGLASLTALFLILLIYLWASGRVWYPRQRGRVEALTEQPFGLIDEDERALGPLDDSLPLNSLRMIASHNSYHLEPEVFRRFAMD